MSKCTIAESYGCNNYTKRTNCKKSQKTLKKVLTKGDESGIIYKLSRRAEREAAARSLKIEQQTKKYKLDSEKSELLNKGLCEEVSQRF